MENEIAVGRGKIGTATGKQRSGVIGLRRQDEGRLLVPWSYQSCPGERVGRFGAGE